MLIYERSRRDPYSCTSVSEVQLYQLSVSGTAVLAKRQRGRTAVLAKRQRRRIATVEPYGRECVRGRRTAVLAKRTS